MSSKIRFVVLDENILGYIDPRTPLTAGVLGSSVVGGATHTWQSGPISLPLDPAWVRSDACPKPLPLDGSHPVKLDPARVRPATRADFAKFRVNSAPYERDTTRYESLAA